MQGKDGSRVFVHSCRESCTFEIDLGTAACTIKSCSWDGARPDLLACQVHVNEGSGSSAAVMHVDLQLYQSALLDSYPLQPDQALIGIALPYLLVAVQGPGDGDPRITRITMTPFVGLPLKDPSLLHAVHDFNVAVCLGNRQAMGQVGDRTACWYPVHSGSACRS